MWDAGEADGAVAEIEKYIREFPARWAKPPPGVRGIEEQLAAPEPAVGDPGVGMPEEKVGLISLPIKKWILVGSMRIY